MGGFWAPDWICLPDGSVCGGWNKGKDVCLVEGKKTMLGLESVGGLD